MILKISLACEDWPILLNFSQQFSPDFHLTTLENETSANAPCSELGPNDRCSESRLPWFAWWWGIE